jgi:DNA-binding response OmpR family regulator
MARILVVIGDRALGELVGRALAAEGYGVAAAASAAVADALLEVEHIDALLLDSTLFAHHEAAQRWLHAHAGTRPVVLMAPAAATDAALGDHTVPLTTPFELGDLLRAVARALPPPAPHG